MKNMNIQKYLLSTVAVFAFIFLYEMVLHGFILADMYQATDDVWRDFEEMSANMSLAMSFQFALSAWTAFMFAQIYPEGGTKNGLNFGLFVGVFAGILMASWYLWLEVPFTLSIAWFVGSVGEGLGAGLILGLIYQTQMQAIRRR